MTENEKKRANLMTTLVHSSAFSGQVMAALLVVEKPELKVAHAGRHVVDLAWSIAMAAYPEPEREKEVKS